DSSSPLYSTGGMYDPAKATALVTIATPGQLLSLGGGSHIHGYVATGPGGMVASGGSAFLGGRNYSQPAIPPGDQTNNLTATFPPVRFPDTDNAQTPTSGTINGVTYTYVLTNGNNFFITNLDSGAYGKSLYVASNNTTLYVAGNIDLTKIVFSTN